MVNEQNGEHPLLDAALAAEYATGVHEETEATARSHILVRLARIGLGTVVTIMGIVMLVLPGPGFLVVAVGLVILSRDVAWADRALRYLRHKVPGVPADGKLPRSSLITMILLGLAGVAFAVWFSLR